MTTASTVRQRKKGVTPKEATALTEEVAEAAPAETSAEEEVIETSFRLVPLIELPVYARVDVLPFGMMYGLLIGTDFYLEQDETQRFVLSLCLGGALLSHLVLVLGCQWKISLRALVAYQVGSSCSGHASWTHCLVQSKTADEAEIVSITREDEAVVAVFHDRVFRYALQTPDEDVRVWKPEDGMPLQQDARTEVVKPRFRPLRYPIDLLPLSFFRTWQGHPTVARVTRASQVYGFNEMRLQLPKLTDLLLEQLVAPFFIFQVFCVTLWSLDEYWYYALFTLVSLLLFETSMAFHRLQSLQRLHQAGQKNVHQRVLVRRGGVSQGSYQWMSVSMREVVPGDYVRLIASPTGVLPIPADILLTQGTAVCDEALLTGESIPQLKHPLEEEANDDDRRLDTQDALHKESILFGGTNLLVSNNPSGVETSHAQEEMGVQGIVLRTGFATTQGNLLRTMAHAPKVDGIHTWDTLVFILLLLVCAIGAAVYVLQQGWQDDRRNRFRLILHVILIVTSVVPPELPMELSLAVTNSFQALVRRSSVYCTEVFRIPWAGQVDMCCFDKTGTLTSDEMILRGVRLFPETVEEEEKTLRLPGEALIPDETIRVMAGCHSLAFGGIKRTAKGSIPTVVGDPLEVAVLTKTGYRLAGNGIVAPPDGGKMIAVLHRFAFSSKLKRMTVLVTEQGGDKDLWALTKGAPETMKEFLSSAPDEYNEIAYHHMSRGRRVLAMGYRRVGSVRKLEEIKKKGREEIESNLIFAGFLVLDCPLKSDTKSVMLEIQKSGHGVAMITGDAALTAVEVARQIEMVPRKASHKVYRIQRKVKDSSPAKGNVLENFEAVEMKNSSPSGSEAAVPHTEFQRLKSGGHVSFCMTGDCLLSLESLVTTEGAQTAATKSSTKDEKAMLLDPRLQNVLAELVPLISVFARHTPYQKEAVIAAFNQAGYTTLMVGDGTNDVGALKRAHCGISIISDPHSESLHREASSAISSAKRKGKKSSRSSLQESLRQLQEAQEELDQVELGDASVAAPFTARSSTIKCVKDVIQQGRCTLVTMLQIYKILGINCLVNAMVLSRLFLHGVKQGDRQLTILGVAVAALFFFVTRAEPLAVLSPNRPPSSVLCFEAMSSIVLQCLVHLAAILIVSDASLAFVDPYDPSLVPDGPFNPNVLNSCTFLLLCLTTVNTFAVNYRGRPFMQALPENKLLYRSLQACYAVLLTCALEIFPPLNDLFQLTALPDVNDVEEVESTHLLFPLIRTIGFQVFLPLVMVVDTVLAFAAEHAMRR